eukprot:7378033-Prymnesium_polylepis.1
MPRRTRWSSLPLAAGDVTALSSLSASLWPHEAAPHTGQQTSGQLFRRHGCPNGPGVLLEQGCTSRAPPLELHTTFEVVRSAARRTSDRPWCRRRGRPRAPANALRGPRATPSSPRHCRRRRRLNEPLPATVSEQPQAAARQRKAPAAPRGQHTPAYYEWLEQPSPQKPSHTTVLTKKSKVKETRSDGARDVRRGELEGVPAQYKGISDFDEFQKLCSQIDKGELKWTELKELYSRGKIVTTESKMTGDSASRSLNEEYMLLGTEAEALMIHVIVRCHRRKRGLTEREIKMWARAQARSAALRPSVCARRSPSALSHPCPLVSRSDHAAAAGAGVPRQTPLVVQSLQGASPTHSPYQFGREARATIVLRPGHWLLRPLSMNSRTT